MNFLIFHAAAFSFLSSETLNLALPGKSDQSIFTHQSLIIDKKCSFPYEADGINDLYFPLCERFYLARWEG